MELKIFQGRQLIDSGLSEEIVAFDRKNMRPIFERAGIEFPEDKRRKGLESDPTFIIAFDGQAIAGYLEYLRSWNDPNYLYIGSIQIEQKHRHSRLILTLIAAFMNSISAEDFVGFETNVLKTNTAVVKLCQKAGFTLEPNPRNEHSWLGRASKENLLKSDVAKLVSKWRDRNR